MPNDAITFNALNTHDAGKILSIWVIAIEFQQKFPTFVVCSLGLVSITTNFHLAVGTMLL